MYCCECNVVGPVHKVVGPVHKVVGPVHKVVGPVHKVVGVVHKVVGVVHFASAYILYERGALAPRLRRGLAGLRALDCKVDFACWICTL